MKVNWKHLAATPGYRSLKAALIRDLQRQTRSRKDLYNLFYRVIGLAVSHAEHSGRLVEEFLNEWEDNRSCWWFSYYSPHTFKLRKPGYQPPSRATSLRATRNWLKRTYRDPKARKRQMCREIHAKHKTRSRRQGKKARWTQNQKFLARYRRKWSL